MPEAWLSSDSISSKRIPRRPTTSLQLRHQAAQEDLEQLPRLLPLLLRGNHPLLAHPRQGIPERDREVLLQALQQLVQRVHRRIEPFRLLDVLGEALREKVVRVVPAARVVGDDLPEGVSQERMDLPDRDTQELPHLGQLIGAGEGWRTAPSPSARSPRAPGTRPRHCDGEHRGPGDDRGLREGRQELPSASVERPARPDARSSAGARASSARWRSRCRALPRGDGGNRGRNGCWGSDSTEAPVRRLVTPSGNPTSGLLIRPRPLPLACRIASITGPLPTASVGRLVALRV